MHALPSLPYAYDALEPHIDARTMEVHHAKHHQAYVHNFNAALEKHPELFEKSPEELIADLKMVPEDIRTAVLNHGGGHVNHSFFWQTLAPARGQKPDGALEKALKQTFGSIEKFQEEFEKSGLSRFGSGWAWLVTDGGKLEIVSTPNQDNPITDGKTPILTVDVWEHAYYLNYQNRRADYLKAFWNVVNWGEVGRRLMEAKN